MCKFVPLYPAIALGCCLGKSCCAQMMSWPCFRRLYLTSFIFVHAQLWPSQVRAPIKGSGVIYPRAFTQPLAILSNTWMERRSLRCRLSQLPKSNDLGKHYCRKLWSHFTTFVLLADLTTHIFQVVSAQCAHKTMTVFILILEFLTKTHTFYCASVVR